MHVNEKGIGEKDGLAIGRNQSCWGMCKYKVPGQAYLKPLDVYESSSQSFPWVHVIILCVVVVFIFGVIIFEHWKKKK
jgi:hypothetical protein